MKPFVITGLPRTRSAWLSAYFNVPHEGIRKGLSLSDIEGTADCGYVLCPAWREAQPKHSLVIIERDPLEVIDSLQRLNAPTVMVSSLAEMLESYYRDALVVQYTELDYRLPSICSFIDRPYDYVRHENFRELYIVNRIYR